MGKLVGYDQLQNLIIQNAEERVFSFRSSEEDNIEDVLEIIPLGHIFLIRGDNVAIVSDVKEEELEKQQGSGFGAVGNATAIQPVVQLKF